MNPSLVVLPPGMGGALPSSTTVLSSFQCFYSYQLCSFLLMALFPVLWPWPSASVNGCGSRPGRPSCALWAVSPPRPIVAILLRRCTSWDRGCSSLLLRVESRKMAPRLVGPFTIQRLISPTAVRLRLPRTMRVHPALHVSKVKQVQKGPPPPPHLIESSILSPALDLLPPASDGRAKTSWTPKWSRSIPSSNPAQRPDCPRPRSSQ